MDSNQLDNLKFLVIIIGLTLNIFGIVIAALVGMWKGGAFVAKIVDTLTTLTTTVKDHIEADDLRFEKQDERFREIESRLTYGKAKATH